MLTNFQEQECGQLHEKDTLLSSSSKAYQNDSYFYKHTGSDRSYCPPSQPSNTRRRKPGQWELLLSLYFLLLHNSDSF